MNSRLDRAKRLIRAGMYDEARAILKEFEFNPEAIDLLNRLDRHERKQFESRPRRQQSQPIIVYTTPPTQTWNPQINIFGKDLPVIPFIISIISFAVMFIAYAMGNMAYRLGFSRVIVSDLILVALVIVLVFLHWRYFWWMIAAETVALAIFSVLMLVSPATGSSDWQTQLRRDNQRAMIEEMMGDLNYHLDWMYGD